MLNSGLVLVARTDAEAATMIDSNIDAWRSRDRVFFVAAQGVIGLEPFIWEVVG